MTRKQMQRLERLINKKVETHVALAQLAYDATPREVEKARNARDSADISLVNFIEDMLSD